MQVITLTGELAVTLLPSQDNATSYTISYAQIAEEQLLTAIWAWQELGSWNATQSHDFDVVDGYAYYFRYTPVDAAGNTATATRFVKVSADQPPALWEKARSFGGVDSDYVAEIQQDHDNNLYILGSFAGSTVTFDNPEGQAVQLSKSLAGVGDPALPGQGTPRNIFILKVSGEGEPLWGKILGVGFAQGAVAGVDPGTYNGGAEYGFGISACIKTKLSTTIV
mgnify:CR=1 FL=1